VRLVISGSNHPRWEVSGNTRDKSAPPRVATNTLPLITPEHPTHLVLPVSAGVEQSPEESPTKGHSELSRGQADPGTGRAGERAEGAPSGARR
jgi:hypothetical protein